MMRSSIENLKIGRHLLYNLYIENSLMMRSSVENLNIGRQLPCKLYIYVCVCVCVCASPWQFEITCNLKTELGEEKRKGKRAKYN
jgi:hypothetical protein